MSDPLDDMIRLRVAGSGPVFEDDDSHVYPPRKWSAEWVRPERGPEANVVFFGDTSGFEHVAKQATAGATLIDERDLLRDLLRALLPMAACECHMEYTAQAFPNGHRPDCPWRQAAEYIKGLKATE